MEMKMYRRVAILSLALLICADWAHAQSSSYSASVTFHSGLRQRPLTEDQVTKILADASKMLQMDPDKDGDVKCDVTLTLKGPVRTFNDPPKMRRGQTLAVVTKDNIDAVHKVDSDVTGVDFHIKVVKEIDFCRAGLPPVRSVGCSFSPPDFRSMIIVHPAIYKGPDRLLWAHEFGHITGLGHRDDDPNAVMTRCPLQSQFSGIPDSRVHVSRDECTHLLAGPGHGSPAPLSGSPTCR
jgi:hypothetical protein